MGGTHFDRLPTAAYGIVLLAAAIAYHLLQKAIIAVDGPDSALSAALGRDLKGKSPRSSTPSPSPARSSTGGSPSASTSPWPCSGSSPIGASKPGPGRAEQRSWALRGL